VLRDPRDILVGGFYQWHFKKTTNLTAPQYFRAYGPEAFVRTRNATSARCYGFYSQLALIERHLWPTVLKSCIVGTTEDMDGFLETLGRVIRVPTSTHGKQLHVRPKYGMNPDIWAAFYQELTPLLREEIAFWKIATSVAQEQHRASRAFTKLISDADEEASRTCHARQGRVGWWVNPRPKRARTKVAVQAELTGARGTRKDREIFLDLTALLLSTV